MEELTATMKQTKLAVLRQASILIYMLYFALVVTLNLWTSLDKIFQYLWQNLMKPLLLHHERVVTQTLPNVFHVGPEWALMNIVEDIQAQSDAKVCNKSTVAIDILQ